jgi:hypothetical protein
MKTRVAAWVLMLCVAVVTVTMGGNVNPPPGPIVGTMKSLSEVEARISVNSLPGDGTAVHIIGQPGSYYLTGDIVGVAGKDGIKITAMGVFSIDLNGFALRGVAGSGHGINSLLCGLWNHFPRVFGGVISDWGGDGIHAESGNFIRARDLVVSSNGGDGIHMIGESHLDAEDLAVTNNAGDGIEISDWAIAHNVTLDDNAGAAVKTLASAYAVELHDVSVSGSGAALSDSGTGTILRNVSVTADGANMTS